MARIELPAALDFGWEMKPLSSARTRFQIGKEDVYDLTIEHSTIRGVTPNMLLWWFRNIGGTMTYRGTQYSRYRVWHPQDHIHWELVRPAPGGGAGVGARFRIVEAFGRNRNHMVDSVETVEKLDATGIRLVRRAAGTVVFSLEHWFAPEPDGTRYNSRMLVGSATFPLGAFFTRVVRPFLFTEEMGHAWLQHNIEEVGNFEFFLPELYRECVGEGGGV